MHPPRAGQQHLADNQVKEKEKWIREGEKVEWAPVFGLADSAIKAIRLNNSPI